MTLDAATEVRLGTLTLDAKVQASDGETVAVLGPNGAGKTTLLRALAGLVPIDRGRISLDGNILDDGGRVFVQPDRRPVGVVFQDYLLFPHLSVLENIAFGLRSRGATRSVARAGAAQWLDRVGLAGIGGAKPRELSGGQAQRVALARALAIEPRLLLLDEPLAALDQQARGAVRRELRSHLSSFGGARILVTHDPLDAAALADRLVILEDGAVTQEGAFADVVAHPRSSWVAALVGVNLLRGTARGDRMHLVGGGELIVPGALIGDALAVIHPHSVAVHRDQPSGSPRNVWPGRVESIDSVGDRIRIRVAGTVPLVAEVTPGAVRELGLVEGSSVWTAVKATDVAAFPA